MPLISDIGENEMAPFTSQRLPLAASVHRIVEPREGDSKFRPRTREASFTRPGKWIYVLVLALIWAATNTVRSLIGIFND